jgi:hypothetical protein
MFKELVTAGIGALLLLDDSKDIGKMDRLHHWHIGAALTALGLASAADEYQED